MAKVLIADDQLTICESLAETLQKEGFETVWETSSQVVLERLKEFPADIVISDIFFGENQPDGVWLVKQLKENFPQIITIVISGESDIYKILDCLKHGATDFIEKPVSLPRLITSIKNAAKIVTTRDYSQKKCTILGKSKAIKEVLFRIQKVAALSECILIQGESGTGKELVAENLHLLSPRFGQPFLRINCAALSPELIESELFGHKKGSFTGAEADKKGFFELASNGTLFLDEVGDLPYHLQTKLLRVLQEKSITRVGDAKEILVNTRVICATHQNLETMIQDGKFREDFYFRIATFKIQVPPLRDRLEDIDILAPVLLQRFLDENNLGYKSINERALQKLKAYTYAGNVRELGIILKNAAIFCDGQEISPEYIEFETAKSRENLLAVTKDLSFIDAKNYLEGELLAYRLREANNDLSLLADSFGIQKTNLYRLLKKHEIDY